MEMGDEIKQVRTCDFADRACGAGNPFCASKIVSRNSVGGMEEYELGQATNFVSLHPKQVGQETEAARHSRRQFGMASQPEGAKAPRAMVKRSG